MPSLTISSCMPGGQMLLRAEVSPAGRGSYRHLAYTSRAIPGSPCPAPANEVPRAVMLAAEGAKGVRRQAQLRTETSNTGRLSSSELALRPTRALLYIDTGPSVNRDAAAHHVESSADVRPPSFSYSSHWGDRSALPSCRRCNSHVSRMTPMNRALNVQSNANSNWSRPPRRNVGKRIGRSDRLRTHHIPEPHAWTARGLRRWARA